MQRMGKEIFGALHCAQVNAGLRYRLCASSAYLESMLMYVCFGCRFLTRSMFAAM